MSETEYVPYTPATPERRSKLTRRGKVVAGIAGLGLAASAAVGLLNSSDSDNHEPKQDAPIFYASQNTEKVKVHSGEGVDDVIQRVYGIDAPEGKNQVVQNNPEYTAEVQAVLDQNGGSDMLQAGTTLNLPVDFYTQAEVDQMQRK